jgi:hypothetical protein
VEDLSNILIPGSIPVKEGLPVLPQATMDGFSDTEQITTATRVMGLAEKEATDEGS